MKIGWWGLVLGVVGVIFTSCVTLSEEPSRFSERWRAPRFESPRKSSRHQSGKRVPNNQDMTLVYRGTDDHEVAQWLKKKLTSTRGKHMLKEYEILIDTIALTESGRGIGGVLRYKGTPMIYAIVPQFFSSRTDRVFLSIVLLAEGDSGVIEAKLMRFEEESIEPVHTYSIVDEDGDPGIVMETWLLLHDTLIFPYGIRFHMRAHPLFPRTFVMHGPICLSRNFALVWKVMGLE